MKTTFAALAFLAAPTAAVLDGITTENSCHNAGGKWVRFWLVDEGDNGMTLELTNTETGSVVSSWCAACISRCHIKFFFLFLRPS